MTLQGSPHVLFEEKLGVIEGDFMREVERLELASRGESATGPEYTTRMVEDAYRTLRSPYRRRRRSKSAVFLRFVTYAATAAAAYEVTQADEKWFPYAFIMTVLIGFASLYLGERRDDEV